MTGQSKRGRSASRPDEATVCAAIEREIEHWAKLRRSQGSKPPRCTPSSSIDYLYGNNNYRCTPHLRQLEKAGLISRKRFDCGGNAWRLTPKGSALAQEGVLLCRSCLEPSLPGLDCYDRCVLCLAELLEAQAEHEEKGIPIKEQWIEDHRARANELRHRAATLRASVPLEAVA